MLTRVQPSRDVAQAGTPPAARPRRSRDRLKRVLRRLLIIVAVSLALTWLAATVLAWTIDPRSAPAAYADTWTPPGTLVTTQMWVRPASVYIERSWQHGAKRSWGPEQATGNPDTPGQGDIPTAWAPASQDAQAEWLELRWAQPVTASAIVVYQTHNPGAVVRVSIDRAGGPGQTIWTARPLSAEASPSALTIPISPARPVDRVRIDLDSPAVTGWNEIDAVCLKDDRGGLVGASHAIASSSYADRTSQRGAAVLPDWSDLSNPPQAPGEIPIPEHRAEGAFGWPFVAWVAPKVLHDRTAAVPGRSKPALVTAPPPAGPMMAVPYRPIIGGLAANLLVYAAALYGLQLVLIRPLRPIRRMVRMQRGHCPACGYDLGFNFAGGCSECGFLRTPAKDQLMR